ncbi:DUF6882 domain-containing protein [Nocardiopsis coralliicola]
MSAPAAEPVRWFSPVLERMGARYAAWTFDQTDVYNAFHPMAEWWIDVPNSLFRQGDITVSIAPLGSFGTDGSWLWAWANEPMHPPGSERLATSLELRAIGEQHGAPELTSPRLELAGYADPRLAAERLMQVCAGLLCARGYGGVTADTGALFGMVMVDEAIPWAELEPASVPSRILRGIEAFPHDHRGTVTGYFERYRFSVQEEPDGSLTGSRPDCAYTAEFDDQGRLARISAKLGGQ